MIKKMIKEAENVKSPERIKRYLKLLWDRAVYLKNNNFMALFYGWGSTASRLEPLRGGQFTFYH